MQDGIWHFHHSTKGPASRLKDILRERTSTGTSSRNHINPSAREAAIISLHNPKLPDLDLRRIVRHDFRDRRFCKEQNLLDAESIDGETFHQLLTVFPGPELLPSLSVLVVGNIFKRHKTLDDSADACMRDSVTAGARTRRGVRPRAYYFWTCERPSYHNMGNSSDRFRRIPNDSLLGPIKEFATPATARQTPWQQRAIAIATPRAL